MRYFIATMALVACLMPGTVPVIAADVAPPQGSGADIPAYDPGPAPSQAELFNLKPDRGGDDAHMGTPTCKTFPEWTGRPIDGIDLSTLGDRPYRIIRPDSVVTMDYIPDRLNIHVDGEGIVMTTDCG